MASGRLEARRCAAPRPRGRRSLRERVPVVSPRPHPVAGRGPCGADVRRARERYSATSLGSLETPSSEGRRPPLPENLRAGEDGVGGGGAAPSAPPPHCRRLPGEETQRERVAPSPAASGEPGREGVFLGRLPYRFASLAFPE